MSVNVSCTTLAQRMACDIVFLDYVHIYSYVPSILLSCCRLRTCHNYFLGNEV
jgi:hypothetical protein